MGTPSIPRLVVAASVGLVTGAAMTHGLEIRNRSTYRADMQEELRRESDRRAATSRWISFRADASNDAMPTTSEPTASSGGWLVFRLKDTVQESDELGPLGLRRQRDEGLVCGKVAAALDAWGERELARQAWEQTRRVLGAESVLAAKEVVRRWLMPGD